jgi:hypothetical protein
MLLGPGHGDEEETPLLFELLRAAGRHVGGIAPVGDVEHEHRLPILALAEWIVERTGPRFR